MKEKDEEVATNDFDTPVERHGTDSLKFDSAEAHHRSPDLLSLWVADMDFRTPDEVVDAIYTRPCLREHAAHRWMNSSSVLCSRGFSSSSQRSSGTSAKMKQKAPCVAKSRTRRSRTCESVLHAAV